MAVFYLGCCSVFDGKSSRIVQLCSCITQSIMNTLSLISKTIFLFGVGIIASHSANSAEVRIMCPGAYVDILTELTPGLERTTKHKVIIIRDGPGNIPNRVRAEE